MQLLPPAFPVRRPLLFLATGFAVASLACSGDDPAATAPGADAQEQRLTTEAAQANHGHYPLEPGWRWTYERSFTMGGEVEWTATSDVWTMGEVDLGDLTAWGIAYRTVETTPDGTDDFYGEVYYVQDRNTLVEIGNLVGGGGGVVTPKPTTGESPSRQYRIGNLTFASAREIPRALDLLTQGVLPVSASSRSASVQDGEIYIREDPRIVLLYPLRPGREWVSFEDPFLQTREVVGRAPLQVPAGNFGAAKILSRSPGLNVEYMDWVSPVGLVARHLEVEITVVTPLDRHPSYFTTLAVEHTELVSLERPHGPRPDARRP